MSYTAILFDLDGTLLPMDQDTFLNEYLRRLSAYMQPHGYDPKTLVSAIWKGTGAMVKNTGEQTNETAFWNVFAEIFGTDALQDIPVFDNFYRTDFELVREITHPNPKLRTLIDCLKAKGIRLILATSPLFPFVATDRRMRWAGFVPEDFEYITTYSNSCRSKPNPEYYQEICDKLGLDPKECAMIGNDAEEDTAAEKIGMDVFLLTDFLLNRRNLDISAYPQGDADALAAFLGCDIG